MVAVASVTVVAVVVVVVASVVTVVASVVAVVVAEVCAPIFDLPGSFHASSISLYWLDDCWRCLSPHRNVQFC